MIRAGAIVLILMLTAGSAAQDEIRAITRDGQRLDRFGQPVPTFNPDFSDVTIDAALESLVPTLGSEDYHEREEAMQALLEGDFEREQIYALLSRRDLNAEQRHRLLHAVIVKLSTVPRGAVGIAMEPVRQQVDGEMQIVVNRLIPGFDAARKLEFRDRITHVDGEAMQNQSDFVRLVQKKRPGETVTLAVKRAARNGNGDVIVNNGAVVFDTLEIPVVLGSLDDLAARPESGNVLRADDHPVINELRWAQREFGQAKRTIEVNGDIPEAPVDQLLRQPIDDHSAIAALLREVEHVREGRMREEIFQRGRPKWQRMVNEMYEHAIEPGISDRERRYRLKAAYRLADLMMQHFDTPKPAVLEE